MSVNFNCDHGMVNIILHCRKNNPMNISPNVPKNSAEAYKFQKMGTQDGIGERSVIFFS